VTDALAIGAYFPITRLLLLADRLDYGVANIPLSYYHNHSIYTMHTDARDRFGTQLGRRFTRDEIRVMMESAGLCAIHFYEAAPFRCAVGFKE
jgi:hypothetical protein